MKTWTWAVLFAVAFALVACVASPETAQNVTQWAQQELAAGRMSQAQYDAIVEGLQGGTDWVQMLVTQGITAATAIFGTNVLRDRARRARREPTGTTPAD